MVNLNDLGNRELPPKNHNNPPDDLEILADQLTLRHVHSIRRAQELAGVVDQMPDYFTEENEAAFITEHIKVMQNLSKTLEKHREGEKESFLRGGQYVDKYFKEYKDLLAIAIEKATRPLDDWLKRKAEAEQLARDADAKLLREQQAAAFEAARAMSAETNAEERGEAVQKAIDLTGQVRTAEAIAALPTEAMARTTVISARTPGKVIASAGLQTKWVGTIQDTEQLDLTKLRPFIPISELQKALDKFVKNGGRQCNGTEIKEIMGTKVK